MSFEIKLTNFEGPLDLLLHLISDNKIDIYDIPIKLITDQYLKVLGDQWLENLEFTSDFVLMATTLLEIKSKMLLPERGEDLGELSEMYADDPRSELVEKLLEYRKYKEAADRLVSRTVDVYTRDDDVWIEDILEDKKRRPLQMDIDILAEAFHNAMLKIPIKDEDRKEFFHSLRPEEYTVSEKVDEIKLLLSDRESFPLMILLERSRSKTECVTYFLATLELLKLNFIRVVQNRNFDEINIIKTDNPVNFEYNGVEYERN